MTATLHFLADSPDSIASTFSIHPLAILSVNSVAHLHTDTGSGPRFRLVGSPDFIQREGSGAVRIVPQEDPGYVVFPQTDGELLVGRFVFGHQPIADTGPLSSVLMY